MSTKRELSNCWANNKKRGLLVALEHINIKTDTDHSRRSNMISQAAKMTSQTGLQARQRYNALMHSESSRPELLNRSQSLPSTVYHAPDSIKRSSTVSISQPVNRSSTGSTLQPVNRIITGSNSKRVKQSSTGSISQPLNRSSAGSTLQPVNRVITGSISQPVKQSSTGSISQPVKQWSTGSLSQPVDHVKRSQFIASCQLVDHTNQTSTGYMSQPRDHRFKSFNDIARSLHSITPGNMDAGGSGDSRLPRERRRSYNGVNVANKLTGGVGGVCVQSERSMGVMGGACVQSLRCLEGGSKSLVSNAPTAVTSKRQSESSTNFTKSPVSRIARQPQYVDPQINCSPLFQQRIKDLLVLQADTTRQEQNKIVEQEKRATAAAAKKKL